MELGLASLNLVQERLGVCLPSPWGGGGLDMASVLGRSPEAEVPLAWPSLQGHRLGDRGRAPCSQSQASCLQSGDTTVT